MSGAAAQPPERGVIEGYFGTPWSWPDRLAAVQWLGAEGYGFFIYAPKADGFLRRHWRAPFPQAHLQHLAALAATCRRAGVRFGIGLSPIDVGPDLSADDRAALTDKLAVLDDLGVEQLAILHDDIRGDAPGLAAGQIALIEFCAARSKAQRLAFCPTYYSDDPMLDQVFGPRPAGYLESLGAGLDPAIDLFWTGEEVCAPEIAPAHLDRVAQRMRRRPLLWDNYPVNDGPRLSNRLHVRAFTGRAGGIGGLIAGHAINPSLQPHLFRVPALSLKMLHEAPSAYAHGEAFQRAAAIVLGPDLAAMLRNDLNALQEVGLDRLSPERRQAIAARYAAHSHPAAREVVAFLEGRYVAAPEVLTQ